MAKLPAFARPCDPRFGSRATKQGHESEEFSAHSYGQPFYQITEFINDYMYMVGNVWGERDDWKRVALTSLPSLQIFSACPLLRSARNGFWS